MAKLPIFFIRVYQILISPLLPPSCRFYPSCSKYSLQAYREYGLFKGSILTIRRISRCHPFHPGGVDPLPLKKPDEISGNYNSAT